MFVMNRYVQTWELPGLASVEVDLGDVDAAESAIVDLGSKVKGDELLISWVEPETRWKTLLVHLFPPQQLTHFFHQTQHFLS